MEVRPILLEAENLEMMKARSLRNRRNRTQTIPAKKRSIRSRTFAQQLPGQWGARDLPLRLSDKVCRHNFQLHDNVSSINNFGKKQCLLWH
mmetsp:Transcript_8566/g.21062  ORF Transcript_8566/g.21062 Transcript_8566/m.21062 type:complete len:91 (+) Transcript_8566:52-324(+)